MSHAELDEAEELDSGDPADLGARYAALREQLPQLSVLGGCCGTDHRHVAEIRDACLRAGLGGQPACTPPRSATPAGVPPYSPKLPDSPRVPGSGRDLT